jgi:archaellum biogenesis ATPase FlaH
MNEFLNQQDINEMKAGYGVGFESKSYIIKTCDEIQKLQVKEKPFIIDNIIPENALTAIVADSGKGKSIFALIMAKHIASGEAFARGLVVKQQKVLIIDQEMDEDIIVSRFKSIVGETVLPIDYMYEQFWAIDKEEDYNWMKDIIIKNEYKVVIFDTLSMIHTKNENDNGEMKEVNKLLLQLIKDTNITIILLHHNRKMIRGEKASSTTARGASEIISKAASQLMLDSTYNIDGQLSITHMVIEQGKRRRPSNIDKFGIDVGYNMQTKQTSWNFKDVNENIGAIAEAKTQVIKLLSSATTGMTVKNLAEDINISEKNIRLALNDLARSGIVRISKKVRPHLHFINEEYATENSDGLEQFYSEEELPLLQI